jgi:TonB family protein
MRRTYVLAFALLLASSALAQDAATPPALIEEAAAELPQGRVLAEGSAATLEITIDTSGAVSEVIVIEAPDPELGAAAAAALQRSRFQPAQRAGQPVIARIRYRYAFAAPPPPAPAEPMVIAPATPLPQAPPTAPAPTSAAIPAEPPPDEEEPTFGATASTEAPAREVTRRPIEAKRIAQLAGANNDPLRAIELLPGVARPPLNNTYVLIRGSGPNDSVVMLEGTPVLFLYHLGGFKSFVNPALLERVDFYPGNFSVRYGRAIGGAIDAHLRSPRRDGFHGLADVSLLDASLMLEGPIGDDFAVAVAGRRSYIDALLALQPADDAIVAAPVYWDYQALASYRAGPDDELYLQAFGSSDSLELLFEQPADELPELRGKLAAETQFHRALLGWRHDYGAGIKHDIKAGVGYLILDAEIGSIVTQRVRSPDFYARADWHAPVAHWLTLDFGLDFAGFSGELEYEGPEFRQSEADPVNDSVDVAVERHIDLLRPAGYFELTLRPVERLSLVPGVRVDYFGDVDKAAVDPRFSARYGITEETTIKAGIGRFSQPPPLGSAIAGLGNPELGPPQAIHLSAGAEQKVGEALTIDLEGYYKWLSDLVVNTEGNVEPRLVNEGKGRVFGLELAAQLEMNELFAALSYSLSRSEREQRDGSHVLFDFDQPHILTASVGYQLGRGWLVSSTFRLVSGNPETPIEDAIYIADDDSYFPIFGRPNSARAALFTRLDLRIEKRWKIRNNGGITLYLDIQNVLNQRHPEATVYGYDYRDTDEVLGLPILPIIGVRGEL